MSDKVRISFTDEQKKAIQLRNRNLLVSASAGTGKTAVLTERIIDILLNEDDPVDIDEMVIVTFTRAAASEMRERIEGKLNDRLLSGDNSEHIKKQIALLPHAKITTIDSLCLNILREYFYIIDIDPAFRIGDTHEIKLLEMDVLDRIIEEKYTEKSESFINMVESLARGSDDSIIGEYILKLYYSAESHAWPDTWLNECREAYDINTLSELDESAWIKESGLIAHTHAIIKDCIGKLDDAIGLCNGAAGYEAIYDMLVCERNDIKDFLSDETYTGLCREIGSYKFARFPTMRRENDVLGIKDGIKALRDLEKSEIEKLRKAYYSKSPETVMEEIKNCKDTVNELIDTVLLFRESLRKEKRELNVLDFNDIEHCALMIISDDNEYAVNELRESFRYILVDEYQDINDVQDAIIFSLSGVRHKEYNVFMVGDVKQSIYGFRLARPEIFEEKRRSYSDADSNCQRIMLNHNFRSSRAILGTVNYIFGHIMKKELGNVEFDRTHEFEFDTPKNGADYGEPAEAIYVSVGDADITEYGKRKLEAAAIGRRIKELADEGISYDDMVILLRSMTGWAEEFVEMLSAMHIPVVAEEHTGYFSAREIRIAIAMLKIIDNPHQDICLTAILRSVFGGFTDEELAVVRAHKRKCDMYTALCYMADGTDTKYGDIPKKCKRFNEKLLTLRKKSLYVRIHELIQMIYALDDFAYHMRAMPMGERRLGNLRMLLEQAVAFENTDKRSLFDFLRYIDRIRSADVDFGEAKTGVGSKGAVRIMSIHKSKGLEFPVVFVSGLGKQMNLSDAKSSVIIQSELGIGMDYFDRSTRVRYKTLIKKVFARRIINDSLGEELRVLYVALTRAKSRLIMTGVINDAEEYFSKYDADYRAGHAEMSGQHVTYYDWLTPHFAAHPSWKGIYADGMDVPPINFAVYNANELILQDIKKYTDVKLVKEGLLLATDAVSVSGEVQDEIDSVINYTYPFQKDTDIAVKVSVSDIKKDIPDKTDDEAQQADWIKKDEEEYVPSFIRKEEKEYTGARRGSFYHIFLKNLIIDEVHNTKDVYMMLERLADAGIMPRNAVKDNVISARKIVNFCKSSIGCRIAAAQRKGECYREQPFVMGLPASEVYKDTDSSEIVLIQGIIDVFFKEDEGIVLLDYKTDRISYGEEDKLKERYGIQLEYYKKAIEKAHGRPVKEMLIYSFALEKEIHL